MKRMRRMKRNTKTFRTYVHGLRNAKLHESSGRGEKV
jgi:hypothetical protein